MSQEPPKKQEPEQRKRKYDPPLSLYGMSFEQAVERALKYKSKKKQPPPDGQKPKT